MPNPILDVPAGDPARHLSLAELEERLAALPAAPKDAGRVVLLQARPGSCKRQPLERARLTAAGGVPGDRWKDKEDPRPEQQLATMQAAVADLIANGQDVTTFGDNLFLDLDLSDANLPLGSQLRCGELLLEVTPEAHNGCLKFKERFGGDALRLVSRVETREHNYRGIYLKVVEAGPLAPGDTLEVIRRGSPS